ncbi:2-phospho-L-lactate guanylyltransferase [Natronoglomus mannanivorans]|uniref:2-phospho-L-lactate guanylyltransferase n=1 Tax=Natronoglomus mannanivorans TaxID=2979990 RepID=A0AAP2YXQ5_9EURY|nr:2-phospho-L-lactate guanylyltransferase [Halobacteria archaeon AArc-xg1-1]
MHAVVPFAAENPKTRLAGVLEPAERERLARAMLVDVLEAIERAGATPTVLTTQPLEIETVVDLEVEVEVEGEAEIPTIVDDRPLTAAVNGVLEERVVESGQEVAVVMADLALVTPDTLERLFSTDGDVVIAPGRGGGTNALVVRHPDFRVDYHGASYLDHRNRATAVDATLETVDSFRLSTDIDEPADLVEVLLHTDGRARRVLEALGLELSISEGRVGVGRSETTGWS